MKIFLLFPRFRDKVWGLPLGVGYLASVLINNDFTDLTVLDGTFQKWDECLQRVREEKPDILGVSVQTIFADLAFNFAREIKKYRPNTLVVFGGPHPTILPEQTVSQSFVDVVCVGEGEYTMLELAREMNLKDINGILYREDGQILANPPRKLIANLDKLPFPAYNLFNPAYFKHGWATVLGSRGCPFNCSFCQPALSKIFSRRVRYRSSENIIEEMIELSDKYNVHGFHFIDDTFTVDKKWTTTLCEKLIEENLGFKWIASTRSDTVTPELLEIMKKAGCIQVCVGVESGDSIIRNEIYNKNITVRQIVDCFKWIKAAGMKGYAYLMVGAPGETRKSILRSLELLDVIKPDFCQATVTTPLLGTNLYSYCQEKGIIQAEKYSDIDYYQGYSTIKLDNFTPDQIKKIKASFFLSVVAHRLMPISYRMLFRIVYPFSGIIEDMINRLKPLLRRLYHFRTI